MSKQKKSRSRLARANRVGKIVSAQSAFKSSSSPGVLRRLLGKSGAQALIVGGISVAVLFNSSVKSLALGNDELNQAVGSAMVEIVAGDVENRLGKTSGAVVRRAAEGIVAHTDPAKCQNPDFRGERGLQDCREDQIAARMRIFGAIAVAEFVGGKAKDRLDNAGPARVAAQPAGHILR